MQVNTSKHKKLYGIDYMGKVGDTLKYFQGCPADFSVKTCVFVPHTELQT